MTEDDILVGNRLIAVYMGITPVPSGVKAIGDIVPPELPEAFINYHSSWNELIPAYNKLRQELLYNRQIRDIFTRAASPIEKCAMKDWPHLGLEGIFDINGSFLKVVDLVRWYNENIK